MVHALALLSLVRGYHEYKDVWSALFDRMWNENLITTVIEQSQSGEQTISDVPQLLY